VEKYEPDNGKRTNKEIPCQLIGSMQTLRWVPRRMECMRRKCRRQGPHFKRKNQGHQIPLAKVYFRENIPSKKKNPRREGDWATEVSLAQGCRVPAKEEVVQIKWVSLPDMNGKKNSIIQPE